MTLTNTSIADIYKVSLPAVNMWIKNAQLKKNNLILSNNNKKLQVVDNENNRAELQKLADLGKKFKTSKNLIKNRTSDEFYKVFNIQEIIELSHSLDSKSEIPHKFTYKNGGAELWDNFYNKNVPNGSYAIDKYIIQPLNEILNFVLNRAENYKHINIIELGPGNGLPAIDFIKEIEKTNKLQKYIAIDISDELLKICKTNITNELPNITFESLKLDIENEKLFKISLANKQPDTINIILYLGATIGIHQDQEMVLKNIKSGMEQGDLCIISNTIDCLTTRSSYPFASNPDTFDQINWIPNLLGLELKQDDLVKYYDEEKGIKVLAFKLQSNYILNIDSESYKKTIELEKGQEVIVWRLKMTKIETLANFAKSTNFKLSGFVSTKDNAHLLMILE